MLAKKFRLPIQRWLKEKKKTISRGSDFFIVKFRENNLAFSRFGVIVSSRIAKKAVKRNNLKRIIFNFLRLNNYHKIPNKDILIIVLSPTSRLTKKETEEKLKQLF